MFSRFPWFICAKIIFVSIIKFGMPTVDRPTNDPAKAKKTIVRLYKRERERESEGEKILPHNWSFMLMLRLARDELFGVHNNSSSSTKNGQNWLRRRDEKSIHRVNFLFITIIKTDIALCTLLNLIQISSRELTIENGLIDNKRPPTLGLSKVRLFQWILNQYLNRIIFLIN